MNHSWPVRLRIYGRDCPAGSAELGRAGEPLRISLEAALANLESLPRMFVELDGSFLWTGQSPDSEPATWQLEGTIYDDGRQVRYIDLRGDCPLSAWQRFLAALDASFTTVMLQLVETGEVVPGEWLEQQLASRE